MISKIESYVKNKVEDYEIYYNKTSKLDLEIMNNKVRFVSDGETHGMSIRIFDKNKIGFAFTNNLEDYKNCLDTAMNVAKASKKVNDFPGFVGKKRYKKVNNYNEDIANLKPKWLNKFIKKFLKHVHKVNSKMYMPLGMFSREIEEVRLINSNGLDLKDYSTNNIFNGSLLLEHNGKLELVDFDRAGNNFLKPEYGTEVAQRLNSVVGKRKVSSGKMQLALHPDALGSLFNTSYSFSVDAEKVQQNKSLFCGKLGKRVFDKKLTIFDDGITEGLLCSGSFDGEGTPSKRFKVIENGVLKNYLYDNYHAKKDGKESTGNAHRGVVTRPYISSNNIIIKSGKTKDIIAKMDKGIYVRNLLGVHTMNKATGDFSLGISEGHYVENGEIKFPIKDTMIAGNFFDMMNNVEVIGKEKIHALRVSGGCYFPKILFKNIKVIGD